MDLTAWQRICHRLLGGVFKKRARADKELSDNLVKASMPMMPVMTANANDRHTAHMT